jgi:hypothetical protein
MPIDYGAAFRASYDHSAQTTRDNNRRRVMRMANALGFDQAARAAIDIGDPDTFTWLNRRAGADAFNRAMDGGATSPGQNAFAPPRAPPPKPPRMPATPPSPTTGMAPIAAPPPAAVGTPPLAGAPMEKPGGAKTNGAGLGASIGQFAYDRELAPAYNNLASVPLRRPADNSAWAPGDMVLIGPERRRYVRGTNQTGAPSWIEAGVEGDISGGEEQPAEGQASVAAPDAAGATPAVDGATPPAEGATPEEAQTPTMDKLSDAQLNQMMEQLGPPEYAQELSNMRNGMNELMRRGLFDEAEQVQGMMQQTMEQNEALFLGTNNHIQQIIPMLRGVPVQNRLQEATAALMRSPYAYGPNGQPTPFVQQILQTLNGLHQSGAGIENDELDRYEEQSLTFAQRLDERFRNAQLDDTRAERARERVGRAPGYAEPTPNDASRLSGYSDQYQLASAALTSMSAARSIVERIAELGGGGNALDSNIRQLLGSVRGQDQDELLQLYTELDTRLWGQVLANLEGLAPVSEAELDLARRNTPNRDMSVRTMLNTLDSMIAGTEVNRGVAEAAQNFNAEGGSFFRGRNANGESWGQAEIRITDELRRQFPATPTFGNAARNRTRERMRVNVPYPTAANESEVRRQIDASEAGRRAQAEANRRYAGGASVEDSTVTMEYPDGRLVYMTPDENSARQQPLQSRMLPNGAPGAGRTDFR